MWCGNRPKIEEFESNKEVAMQGTVEFYTPMKDYGFIKPNLEDRPEGLPEGKGIHFNDGSLVRSMTLAEKDSLTKSESCVEFDLEESDPEDGKFHAVNVRAVAV